MSTTTTPNTGGGGGGDGESPLPSTPDELAQLSEDALTQLLGQLRYSRIQKLASTMRLKSRGVKRKALEAKVVELWRSLQPSPSKTEEEEEEDDDDGDEAPAAVQQDDVAEDDGQSDDEPEDSHTKTPSTSTVAPASADDVTPAPSFDSAVSPIDFDTAGSSRGQSSSLDVQVDDNNIVAQPSDEAEEAEAPAMDDVELQLGLTPATSASPVTASPDLTMEDLLAAAASTPVVQPLSHEEEALMASGWAETCGRFSSPLDAEDEVPAVPTPAPTDSVASQGTEGIDTEAAVNVAADAAESPSVVPVPSSSPDEAGLAEEDESDEDGEIEPVAESEAETESDAEDDSTEDIDNDASLWPPVEHVFVDLWGRPWIPV